MILLPTVVLLLQIGHGEFEGISNAVYMKMYVHTAVEGQFNHAATMSCRFLKLYLMIPRFF